MLVVEGRKLRQNFHILWSHSHVELSLNKQTKTATTVKRREDRNLNYRSFHFKFPLCYIFSIMKGIDETLTREKSLSSHHWCLHESALQPRENVNRF